MQINIIINLPLQQPAPQNYNQSSQNKQQHTYQKSPQNSDSQELSQAPLQQPVLQKLQQTSEAKSSVSSSLNISMNTLDNNNVTINNITDKKLKCKQNIVSLRFGVDLRYKIINKKKIDFTLITGLINKIESIKILSSFDPLNKKFNSTGSGINLGISAGYFISNRNKFILTTGVDILYTQFYNSSGTEMAFYDPFFNKDRKFEVSPYVKFDLEHFRDAISNGFFIIGLVLIGIQPRKYHDWFDYKFSNWDFNVGVTIGFNRYF